MARPPRVPATIVSGRPTPTRRAGTVLAAQGAKVDPDRVGEQHQGEGRLGQQPYELVGDVDIDQVQGPDADQQTEGDEEHRLGDRRRP